jgi:signal transduction histidine kinase/CheY-like chemotaxis protein
LVNLRLRSKILLALLTISAGLTCGTLAVVRYTVQNRVRESLEQELRSSVRTYQTFQDQQDAALAHTAASLASLPTVRALISTQDRATIKDGIGEIARQTEADLLLFADRRGMVTGVRSSKDRIEPIVAQYLLNHTFEKGATRDWWLTNGRLYHVVVQPVEFGQNGRNTVIGVLVAGDEIDQEAALEFSAIIGSEVVFRTGDFMVSSRPALKSEPLQMSKLGPYGETFEIQLGQERYLGTTEKLYRSAGFDVSLTVLKSFDAATAFLTSLNHVLAALGLIAILCGTLLGYTISRSISKPLGNLVAGVNALEQGDFQFPLSSTSNDEVGVVTAAFNHLRQSLRQGQEEQRTLEQRLRQAHKMEAVGRLAGGVAHDFNNLLTIIRGNADLLFERVETDARKKNIEQIQKASERAVGMTRQLLAFSRMQVLQPRVLDLNQIISELGKMLPRLIGEHIEYSFVPQQNLYSVLADPGQIEQVLMNLAVNARDAMPDGGTLRVRTNNVEVTVAEAARRPAMLPGSYARISVVDSGQGMSEETKAHIFEPFFTTKGVGKGTGLGLATVYGIVKQSRGFIWVESQPGHGSTFEIFLPITSATPDSNSAAETAPGQRRASETVLIVEDEPGVRDLAHQFLKNAGYKVLEARDGTDALEISGRFDGTIDLLLTDMVMPRMSGLEVARTLRATRPAMKVVIMSGYSDFDVDAGAAERFASMGKPFSMKSLLQKLEEVLHGGEVRESTPKK